MPKTDYSRNIYSPHETAMVGYKQAKRAAEHSQFGIELDIPGTVPAMKEYVPPLLPWEICAIQAQTSNGKTMFTNWWIRKIAEQLKRQKRDDEVIIHVSLEETVEAIAFQEYGRILSQKPADFARGAFTDWKKMQWAMGQIDKTPVWTIGDSSERPENAPELYLTNIYRAIKALVDGEITGSKIKPAVVIVDYLQALPIDPEVKQASREQQRRLQVAQDVFRLREMTTHLECPFIVPLQAKQELQGNNEPYMIPGTYDGMETSAIATRFDRIFSLWMPKTTHLVGQTVFDKEKNPLFRVEENQVFFKVNKQRGGMPAGMVWQLKVDYETGEYMDAYYKPRKTSDV
jgi:hypothetical protein